MKRTIAVILSVIISVSSIAVLNAVAETGYTSVIDILRDSFSQIKYGEAISGSESWVGTSVTFENPQSDPTNIGLESAYGNRDDFFVKKVIANGWCYAYIPINGFEIDADYFFYIYSDRNCEIDIRLFDGNTSIDGVIQTVDLAANSWTKVPVGDQIKSYTGVFDKFAVTFARNSFDVFGITPILKLTENKDDVTLLDSFQLYEKAKNIDLSMTYCPDSFFSVLKELDDNIDFQTAYLGYLAENLNSKYLTLEKGRDTKATFGKSFNDEGHIFGATPDIAFVEDFANRLGENFSCFNLTAERGIWANIKDENGYVIRALYNDFIKEKGNETSACIDAVLYLYTGEITTAGNFKIEYHDEFASDSEPKEVGSIMLTPEMSNKWIRISLIDNSGVQTITDLSDIVSLRLAKDNSLAASNMYLSDLLLIDSKEAPITYSSVNELITAATELKKDDYIDTDAFDNALEAVNSQKKLISDLEKSKTEKQLIDNLKTAWNAITIYEANIISVISTSLNNSAGLSAINDFKEVNAPTDAPEGYNGKWFSFNKKAFESGWANVTLEFNPISINDYKKFKLYLKADNCIRDDDPNSNDFEFTFDMKLYSSSKRINSYKITSDEWKIIEILQSEFSDPQNTSINKYLISFEVNQAQRQLACSITLGELIGYKEAAAKLPADCDTIDDWYNAAVDFIASNEIASGVTELENANQAIYNYLNPTIEPNPVTMLGVKRGISGEKIGYIFGTNVKNEYDGLEISEYGTYLIASNAVAGEVMPINEQPNALKLIGKQTEISDDYTAYTVSLLNVTDSLKGYIAVSYAEYSSGTTTKIVYSDNYIAVPS